MKFRIRCSAIGEIMGGTVGLTDTQDKKLKELEARHRTGAKPLTDRMMGEMRDLQEKRDNPTLPAGAITYVKKWMADQAFNRRIEHSNKYTEKGHATEDAALAHLGLTKNETFYENDFLQGTPDGLEYDSGNLVCIHDVKNSWDHHTFPMYETEVPNSGYWWQGQGYMCLLGCKNYKLQYFLQSWVDERTGEVYDYDHIDINERIKTFPFSYDPDAIEQVKVRVAMCQAFVNKHYRELKRYEGGSDDF